MAQNFNPGPPPVPVAPASKSKKHKAKPPKTPKQVAERGVKIAQEREKITHAEFNRQWQAYNEIYMAYSNRNASRGEALALISRGITRTTLAKYLATLPSFYKSDIWKANADKYFGPARNMGMKVNKKFVAQAIANNWDPYVFQEKLRQRPEYLQSNEYKTTAAGLTLSFQKLYGKPDQGWSQEIQKAALGRWTPDQWETKLRSLPEYTQSSEYQSKLYEFKSLLGYH